jgi:hypothetical protein
VLFGRAAPNWLLGVPDMDRFTEFRSGEKMMINVIEKCVGAEPLIPPDDSQEEGQSLGEELRRASTRLLKS